jgi:hypothetical protein
MFTILNKQVTSTFFNFFILLLVLNPFLLIDPELFILFSISLIILLFINDLSEVVVNTFNVKLIQYYYFYIRFFNVQLIFLFELAKFMNLYLYVFNIPYFVKWYQFYFSNLSIFFDLNFSKFNNILNLNFMNFIRSYKIFLLHFYINYYFLMRKAWRHLFIKKRWSNYRILTNYVLKHFLINNGNRTVLSNNLSVNRLGFNNLLKILKLKV